MHLAHTLTHITEHPNFTLKAGAHCSLLASPVAGVRHHQGFHSMKVALQTPPHEETNQEYIDGDYEGVIGLQTFLKISIYIVY